MNKWLKVNGLKILGIGITLLVLIVGIIVQFDRYGQDIEDMTAELENMSADFEDVEDSVKEIRLMIERLSVSVGGHSASLYRIESILLED